MTKPIWQQKRAPDAHHHSMTPREKALAARIAKKHGTKVGLADRLAAIAKSK
jgi:hypothetical protein